MSDNIKLQKLASAVYLLTNFFPEEEPLKWKLRSVSLDLASEDFKDKSALAKELNSFFSIAKNVGLVSDVNYEILNRELSKLEGDSEKSLSSLLVSEERALPQPKATEPYLDKKALEKPVLKGFGAVSIKKNSRQNTIVNLIKRKKEIMIKDVTPLISGCSEKTIQRELLSMVASGILKKTGEKRWSRYSLA